MALTLALVLGKSWRYRGDSRPKFSAASSDARFREPPLSPPALLWPIAVLRQGWPRSVRKLYSALPRMVPRRSASGRLLSIAEGGVATESQPRLKGSKRTPLRIACIDTGRFVKQLAASGPTSKRPKQLGLLRCFLMQLR